MTLPPSLSSFLPFCPFMARWHFYYHRRLLAAPSTSGSALRRLRRRCPRRTPLKATAATSAASASTPTPTSTSPAAAESAMSSSGSCTLRLHHRLRCSKRASPPQLKLYPWFFMSDLLTLRPLPPPRLQQQRLQPPISAPCGGPAPRGC